MARRSRLLRQLAQAIQRAKNDAPVALMLVDCGSQKIQVIKALRQFTGLGLAEAKDVTDRAPAPLPPIPRTQALELKTQLEALGASVRLG
jgi:large subunit ribosomal protein L7/L12